MRRILHNLDMVVEEGRCPTCGILDPDCECRRDGDADGWYYGFPEHGDILDPRTEDYE